MFDRHLGGGALLDLGVYPVSFLSMVLGTPASVTASTQFGDTGVDGQTSVITGYADGRQGVATSSMEAFLPNHASDRRDGGAHRHRPVVVPPDVVHADRPQWRGRARSPSTCPATGCASRPRRSPGACGPGCWRARS